MEDSNGIQTTISSAKRELQYHTKADKPVCLGLILYIAASGSTQKSLTIYKQSQQQPTAYLSYNTFTITIPQKYVKDAYDCLTHKNYV